MIRPQQRRAKEHQAAIAAVKKGDDVITGGGIRGRVTKVTRRRGGGRDRHRRQGPRDQVDDQPGARRRQAGQRLRPDRCSNSRAGKSGWSPIVVAIGVLLSIPSLIAGTTLAGSWPKWLPQYASASASTSPAAATCCSKPMRRTRRSSGCRRWRIRSRPSFATIRGSRSATSRPPAGGCRSWSAIRRRSMPRSSGCAT